VFVTGSGRRVAAVLVPVYDGPLGPTLILLRRTRTINHPGQIAFPGGRPEPGDADLQATALREAHEDLGIEPADVTIVGALPVVETLTTNWAITPFVGRLRGRPVLRPQPAEVDAVLEVPVAALRAPGLPIVEEWHFSPSGEFTVAAPGSTVAEAWQRRPIRIFPWDQDKIWGATQRMLETFLAALDAGTLVL
jgi:8-oxo-dGTP pyrophosphatase MutT (NUDIX family)